MNKSETIIKVIISAVIVGLMLPMVVIMTLYNGFVFMILWGWFVTETFGVHQLTLLEAIGLTIMISLLTTRTQIKEEYIDKSTLAIVSQFIIPLVLLFVGFIVHWFMHR